MSDRNRLVTAAAALALTLAATACGTTVPSGVPHAARLSLGASGAPGGTLVAELPDPEAAQAFPQAANAPPHALAKSPSQAALATTVAPGAPSDAQVRAELRAQQAVLRAERLAHQARPGQIAPDGSAAPPRNAPATVARVIAGGNAIATFPYVFGGGHVSFVDSAYDCSGSVSYALAAAGMLSGPVTSGQLEQWGVPGPGRWLTVFANAGHTFMYVAGLRFDTSGRDGPFGSRWQTAPRSTAGFVARHWPGL